MKLSNWYKAGTTAFAVLLTLSFFSGLDGVAGKSAAFIAGYTAPALLFVAAAITAYMPTQVKLARTLGVLANAILGLALVLFVADVGGAQSVPAFFIALANLALLVHAWGRKNDSQA